MNKAFVKEPEPGDARCPRCESAGVSIGPRTLESFVRAEFLAEIAATAYFCEFPRCDVAYFDEFERYVTVDQLVKSVWPKDVEAPLCGCFGLTANDIEQDVAEGSVERVRAAVEKSKSPAARCEELSPTGHNCAGRIQRHYFKLREQR